MEVLGKGFKRTKEKGVTLLESIVATVIVSIGFIALKFTGALSFRKNSF